MFGFTDDKTNDYNLEEAGLITRRKIKMRGGGIVFIGPIPIVFASNMKIAVIMIIIAIIIILLSYFLIGLF
jgi:uncharacterized protein (TIGR00304 family)